MELSDGPVVEWEREHDGFVIRAVRHECSEKQAPGLFAFLLGCAIELELLATRPGADAWYTVGQAEEEPPPPDELIEMLGPLDAGVIDRLVAVFGLPWREMTQDKMTAQLRTLCAPAWFHDEFLSWEPDELLALRGNVCGGQDSFVRALRAVREYRLSTDRVLPS